MDKKLTAHVGFAFNLALAAVLFWWEWDYGKVGTNYSFFADLLRHFIPASTASIIAYLCGLIAVPMTWILRQRTGELVLRGH
ncbi:hypothetical protein [Motiliproteus sp. MSK22-1]|uniref:hypothetical protein n=1 Tax=Motiliproteus sp. MSK22-1 TaxID=1897630 RepID=UPI0009756A5A|nr:hypothetical protein [Motiliproteus sp. MSK22-1]OMH33741.1 hypothetical protein BGP75_12135 [Motiliproteus sp. MSK22-1]